MTADLRARIAEALRRHDANMDSAEPRHEADEAYGCCADAVMAVLMAPTEYGVADTDWAWATRATHGPGMVIWPADSEADARATVARREPRDGWRAVALRRECTAWREVEDARDAAPNEVSRLGEEIGD